MRLHELPQKTGFHDLVPRSYVCFGGAIMEWNENLLLGRSYCSKSEGVFFCFNDTKFCWVDCNSKILNIKCCFASNFNLVFCFCRRHAWPPEVENPPRQNCRLPLKIKRNRWFRNSQGIYPFILVDDVRKIMYFRVTEFLITLLFSHISFFKIH